MVNFYIVVWLSFSILTARFASKKGLSGFKFFLLSIIFSPLVGFVAAFAASPKINKDEEKESEMAEAIKTIQIGEQVWMVENLNASNFRNGDPIPEAKTKEEWEQAGGEGTPAWCYYDNDPENGNKYGKLYNWFAVNDPRRLVPEEWCIPGEDEFALLLEECRNAGESAYNALIEGGSSGFSSLFGGWRNYNGEFYSLDIVAGYWSATAGNDNDAYRLNVIMQRAEVDIDTIYYSLGFSVRCLKA